MTNHPIRAIAGRVYPADNEVGLYWTHTDVTEIFPLADFEDGEALQQAIDLRDDCEVLFRPTDLTLADTSVGKTGRDVSGLCNALRHDCFSLSQVSGYSIDAPLYSPAGSVVIDDGFHIIASTVSR